jgi:hypothetical protein
LPFDLAERNKDLGTSSFKLQVPKKIVPVNLYNPHAEVEADATKLVPGPGTYNHKTYFHPGKLQFPQKY